MNPKLEKNHAVIQKYITKLLKELPECKGIIVLQVIALTLGKKGYEPMSDANLRGTNPGPPIFDEFSDINQLDLGVMP